MTNFLMGGCGRGRLFLIIVCWLSSFFIAKGQLPTGKLSSTADFIKAVQYYRYQNPDSAVFFVKSGLKNALAKGDELGYAALLNQYGMIKDNLMAYESSFGYYLRSMAIYKRLGDEKGLASALIRLGVVEKRKANYDKSLAHCLEALALSEKNGHKMGVLEARVTLSEVYLALGELNNCYKNLKIAESINRQLPLSNLSLNMYISFGNYFLRTNQHPQAIAYIKTGLANSNRTQFNGSRIGLLKLLGAAYFEMGEFEKAAASLKAALTGAREIKNVLREQTILNELANIYQQRRPDSALAYLQQALQIATGHRIYSEQVMILERMSALRKQRGEFSSALSLLERSYGISKQIYYRDMAKQVNRLERAYELERSNVQLAQLKLQTRQQQESRNIILSIAITVSLVLLVTLIYFYRTRDLNRQLLAANIKLEGSNAEKDKFFSVLAHDIRSPMASTVSILKFIANKELEEEEQQMMVGKLILHSESSLEILDKLLKWGQLQIKGVKLNITEFSPAGAIRSNLALLAGEAERKEITVELDIPEGLVLLADANHFDFVVRNLLANAIKFTPTGGSVLLRAKMLDDHKVSIQVKDNGVGITEQRIKHIFGPTAMGTKGTSDELGFSLGLMICKQFIDANQGTLSLKSLPGKGTSVRFVLKGFQR